MLLIALVMLVMLLAGSSASAISDTSASVNDSNIDKVATNQTQASNCSASAIITITMYAVADE